MSDQDKQEEIDALERQRIQRRREHMAAMRRRKGQQELFRRWAPVIAVGLAVLALAIWGLVRLIAGPKSSEMPKSSPSRASGKSVQLLTARGKNGLIMGETPGGGTAPGNDITGVPSTGENVVQGSSMDGSQNVEPSEEGIGQDIQEPETVPFTPRITEHVVGFPEEGRGVYSTNGVLMDAESGEVIAVRDASQRINPASMTKILTLLVAAEHVEDLQDSFVMTIQITDYAYRHDCSIAGFGVGQSVTVEELMYGTILPSGADAALALAEYVAGSQEAFVELMNQKLEQLGLSDTAHFTNCVGLYDEDHYCTVYDMAVILKAAADNELCRKVLSARTFATSVPSEQQPEGILLSNWFLRRIEDKDTHGEILCAKTGFVNQSGSCAASLAADSEGREYICVTTGSMSSWTCIYDHVELYQAFLK